MNVVEVRDLLVEALNGVDEVASELSMTFTFRDALSKAFVAVALEAERQKLEAMTPEEKVAYYREIVAAQLAAAKPYVPGERQARPQRVLVVTGNMPRSVESRLSSFRSYHNATKTGVTLGGTEVMFRSPDRAALAGLRYDSYILEHSADAEIAHWLSSSRGEQG